MLHLDKHLGNIIAEQGRGRAYALLAAIVFCETGLVRTINPNRKDLGAADGKRTHHAVGNIYLEHRVLVLSIFCRRQPQGLKLCCCMQAVTPFLQGDSLLFAASSLGVAQQRQTPYTVSWNPNFLDRW